MTERTVDSETVLALAAGFTDGPVRVSVASIRTIAAHVKQLTEEHAALLAALRPFAEAQGVADLRAARAVNDYLLASEHVRPSAFRIARDVVVVIDSRKEPRG